MNTLISPEIGSIYNSVKDTLNLGEPYITQYKTKIWKIPLGYTYRTEANTLDGKYCLSMRYMARDSTLLGKIYCVYLYDNSTDLKVYSNWSYTPEEAVFNLVKVWQEITCST